MSKNFEYADDNPGSYFGMLVESVENKNESLKEDLIKKYNMPDREDSLGVKVKLPSSVTLSGDWTNKLWEDGVPILKYFDRNSKYLRDIKFAKGREFYVNQNYDKAYLPYKDGWMSVDLSDLEYELGDDWLSDIEESLKEDSEYKTLAKLSNGLEVISYPYGYAVSDGYVADRFVVRDGKYIFDDGRFRLSDKDKQKILSLINKGVIGESLKEDKFVPKDKMSKKAQKELNDKKRGTWSNTNPVTRVQPNKKAYDRKRDKKELDESLTEDSEVFKDMSNALDDIEYLCNDTYNWGTDDWNNKEKVKNTAEKIIDSASVLLDSIKKY